MKKKIGMEDVVLAYLIGAMVVYLSVYLLLGSASMINALLFPIKLRLGGMEAMVGSLGLLATVTVLFYGDVGSKVKKVFK